MSTTNERPTPETDALFATQNGQVCASANLNFARRLERERDGAREKLDAVSKRAERIRCELVQAEVSRVTNAALYERAIKERDDYRRKMIATEAYQCGLAADVEAMREAVRDAHGALLGLSECRIFYGESMDIDSYATEHCNNALAKLQPFLKS